MPELGDGEGEAKGPALARGGARRGHGGDRAAHAARARAARARVRRRGLRAPDPAGGARARADHGGGRATCSASSTEARVTLVDPELAERVLERALARGGDFAELYAEERSGFAISLDDGRVERPQGGRERGACVRVVQGDSTYFGHVDGLAEADLLRVADSVSQALRGEARARRPRSRRRGPGQLTRSRRRPEEVAAARKADAAARLRRARPRGRAPRSRRRARLRRVAAPGRGLQLRRARGRRRPHARAARRAGGGAPRRPRRDRHATRAAATRASSCSTPSPEAVAEQAARRALTLLDAVDAPTGPDAGGGRQRLRRRAPPRGDRPRPRGRRGPEATRASTRAGSASSSRADS